MPNAHRTAASAPALRQPHSALAHCARAANTAANTSCFGVHRWRTPGQLSPPLLGSPSLRLADTQTTLRPSHSCSTRPAICRPRLLDVPSSIRFERAASLSKPFSLGRRGGHLLFPARPSATPMTTTTTPRLRISGPMTLRGPHPPESARTQIAKVLTCLCFDVNAYRCIALHTFLGIYTCASVLPLITYCYNMNKYLA